MGLEELIITWSKERPGWQREIMRRAAAGEVLSADDYERLLEDIVQEKEIAAPQFGLEQLQPTPSDDAPVSLLSIEKPEHVNALESKEPLTFEPAGLTIVYGDNGSGKSGYARLLKRIARARHREDVLTDVFRDTSLAKPTALLSVKLGDAKESVTWPESSRPELQRMLFYDAACGNAYIVNESDFPYRPSGLFVMDALIEACVAIRTRIDAKLAANAISAHQLLAVPDQVRGSDMGEFLVTLSGKSSLKTLDALIARFDEAKETIKDLNDQEAGLRSADTTRAHQQLIRQSEKIAALRDHFEGLNTAIGGLALEEIRQRRATVNALEEAASLLARSFESEPLAGIGSSSWKSLWEAAQRFSKEYAYPRQDFPSVHNESRCVLCLQTLDAESRNRFVRFGEFVRNDVQVRLQEAKRLYEQRIAAIRTLKAAPAVVESNLSDLEDTNRELVTALRELLAKFELAIGEVRKALQSEQEIPAIEIDSGPIVSSLTDNGAAARAAAEELANPEGIQRQLASVTARRAELELIEQVKKARSTIVEEIARLKEREALEAAKSAAATTGITKKILELSEESITEVVRDTFTRETERLRLDRVTITRTRADKGALLHQPKLVGARQQATLPRVFSEGERTALGLAAFFTEAQLDGSKSALILDDPVTSLDHIRRGLVATRLVELAESREVILFTHDLALVADLRRAANARGVQVSERCVAKSRSDARKPGVCTTKHPWKAKDVPARLGELRQELDRIRSESSAWDESKYEDAVAIWAGNLSETWERIFSQEIVGPILAEGGLEVRPMMVKVLALFSDQDYREFDASYSRVTPWAKRHDKSVTINYVSPDLDMLDGELRLVDTWFRRVKGYKA